MTGLVQTPPPPADSLRAALREVFAAREYDWTVRRGALAWLREQYLRLLDWFAGLEQSHPAAYYLLLAAMTVVLVAILVHFGYILWRTARYRETGGAARPALAAVRDAAWHEAEARRLAGVGRYAEALGHRFLALILQLERREAVTFHPAKTPAEYVVEARLDQDGRGALAELVRTLYAHLFGGQPCSDDQWREFDRRATDLGGPVAAY